MARFDLAQIAGYKAEASAINVTLPQGGVYLLMCALTTMNNRFNWRSGDDDLSDNDWDDLDEELSALILAIMTEVSAVTFPIGCVVPFPVDVTPSGFLLCNGDQYLRVNYPLLYAVLSAAFIVDADNFTVPDLDETFIRGIGDGLDDPGDTGGTKTHTLVTDEMPMHNHGIKYNNDGVSTGGVSRLRVAGGAFINNTEIVVEGKGFAHNNTPPYMALPYYIRAV